MSIVDVQKIKSVQTILSNSIFIYIYHLGNALYEMVIVGGNGHVDRIQNLEVSVYISHSANTLRKGMNPTIFLTVMGKYEGRLGFLNLGMITI